MSVLVAKIDQSPWPEMVGHECDGSTVPHDAEWVIWTEQDTGDGMRFSCSVDLAGWVEAMWDRIDGNNTDA